MRVPRISLGKLFNVLQSPIGRMASWPMRNIKTFPSKQMYLYLSLVERKEAEFYHNIDRRHYLVWFIILFSSLFPDNSWCPCIISSCIAWYCIVGFGAWALFRKTPISISWYQRPNALLGKVVKFWMRPQPQRTYFEKDQVDLPIVLVLHGGDTD